MPDARPNGKAPFRRGLTVALVLALLTPVTGLASDRPLPAIVADAIGALQPVGTGQLRWMGLRIYEATLWTPDGEYNEGSGPFALAIRYQRDIPSNRLVRTTMEEMERLDVGGPSVDEWERRLSEIFPDVKPGDRIVGVALPDQGTRFVLERGSETNGAAEVIGQIDDAAFTSAFFAIWLNKDTRLPGLRRELVGR